MRLLEHPLVVPLRPVAGRHTAIRQSLKARADGGLDALRARRGLDRELDGRAAAASVLDVLVVGVDVPGGRMAAAIAELRASRHRVEVVLGTLGDAPTPGLEDVTALAGMRAGKFDNINRLLELGAQRLAHPRWTIVIDHDVKLPGRFLDRFLAVAEACDLAICQPALTLRSFHSHAVTRRRPLAVARETRFVEIGPLTALRADAAAELLPFPADAGMGWGLDRFWPALAARHGWRMGVVDATPVGHEDAPAAAGYSWHAAMEDAERFLAERPSVGPEVTRRTVRAYRCLP